MSERLNMYILCICVGIFKLRQSHHVSGCCDGLLCKSEKNCDEGLPQLYYSSTVLILTVVSLPVF